MSQKYADIIIDISHEGVDKTFEYKIPEELSEQVQVGSVVKVPFGQGNRTRQGYVIAVKDSSKWDPDKMKSILQIDEKTREKHLDTIGECDTCCDIKEDGRLPPTELPAFLNTDTRDVECDEQQEHRYGKVVRHYH